MKLVVKTTDGKTHEITCNGPDQARTLKALYIKTGFSQGNIAYTPYHTVSVEVVDE